MLQQTEYTKMKSRLAEFWFKTYNEYLHSELWEQNKAKFKNCTHMRKHIAKHWYCCEFCLGNWVLHVHHWTYKRLCEEYMYDLSLICADCHNKVHNTDRGTLWRTTKLVRRAFTRPRTKSEKNFKSIDVSIKPSKPWKRLLWYKIW